MEIMHTPGPWLSEPMKWDANESMIFNADRTNWIAHIQHNGEPMPCVQNANARIMAAAPDLLAVAQAVIAHGDSNMNHELLAAAKKAVEACCE